jgi:hypothetical protein
MYYYRYEYQYRQGGLPKSGDNGFILDKDGNMRYYYTIKEDIF